MSSSVVGITLLWAISVDSEKLCCNDRMGLEGLGVRNVCTLLGIKTPNGGTTSMPKMLRTLTYIRVDMVVTSHDNLLTQRRHIM